MLRKSAIANHPSQGFQKKSLGDVMSERGCLWWKVDTLQAQQGQLKAVLSGCICRLEVKTDSNDAPGVTTAPK